MQPPPPHTHTNTSPVSGSERMSHTALTLELGNKAVSHGKSGWVGKTPTACRQ